MEICTLSHEKVLSLLPDRAQDSHKGDYGRILLLCGSRGYTGAAALAAMGALRSGAGLVYLGVPESIYAIEAMKLLEPVVLPLPEEDGKLSLSAAEKIRPMLPNMDAVLFGPGCGRSNGGEQLLQLLLGKYLSGLGGIGPDRPGRQEYHPPRFHICFQFLALHSLFLLGLGFLPL